MRLDNYDMIEVEGIRINYLEQTVHYNGIEIELTNREFQVLYFLIKYRGQVFSPKQIYNQVTGLDDKDDFHTVEITISRIKTKLKRYTGKNNLILTIRGRGYKFKK